MFCDIGFHQATQNNGVNYSHTVWIEMPFEIDAIYTHSSIETVPLSVEPVDQDVKLPMLDFK